MNKQNNSEYTLKDEIERCTKKGLKTANNKFYIFIKSAYPSTSISRDYYDLNRKTPCPD